MEDDTQEFMDAVGDEIFDDTNLVRAYCQFLDETYYVFTSYETALGYLERIGYDNKMVPWYCPSCDGWHVKDKTRPPRAVQRAFKSLPPD